MPSSAYYASAVNDLYALGIVAFGPLPGWLADRTGGYVASYLLGMWGPSGGPPTPWGRMA